MSCYQEIQEFKEKVSKFSHLIISFLFNTYFNHVYIEVQEKLSDDPIEIKIDNLNFSKELLTENTFYIFIQQYIINILKYNIKIIYNNPEINVYFIQYFTFNDGNTVVYYRKYNGNNINNLNNKIYWKIDSDHYTSNENIFNEPNEKTFINKDFY